MKTMKWLPILAAVLLLAGCSGRDGQQQKQEEWKMNDTMIRMICDAAGCTEGRAEAILEDFRMAGLAEPVRSEPVGGGSRNITVETADGGKYEIALNKKLYVDTITDLSTGKYVYMVIE